LSHLRHLSSMKIIVVPIDLRYHEGRVTSCTGVINVLNRTIHSFWACS
jgi:hypothetical protein